MEDSNEANRRAGEKEKKTATSTWNEGTRYINPKPTKGEDQEHGRNKHKRVAIMSINRSRPSSHLTLPRRQVLGNTASDGW